MNSLYFREDKVLLFKKNKYEGKKFKGKKEKKNGSLNNTFFRTELNVIYHIN